jgi:hypothetical protein
MTNEPMSREERHVFRYRLENRLLPMLNRNAVFHRKPYGSAQELYQQHMRDAYDGYRLAKPNGKGYSDMGHQDTLYCELPHEQRVYARYAFWGKKISVMLCEVCFDDLLRCYGLVMLGNGELYPDRQQE